MRHFGGYLESLLSDSDFDGLPDVWEIQNQRNPVLADYHIDTGINHSCGIDDVGVVCWGKDTYGESSPPELSNPSQVAVGFFHSCALADDGVTCWGSRGWGLTAVPILSNPRLISSSWRRLLGKQRTWSDHSPQSY